jgi:hypothetical protein
MRKILFRTIIFLAPAALLTGCIEETLPNTSYTTGSQVAISASAVQSLANGTTAFMYAYNYFGTLASQEFGYPAMMIIRDALTDAPYVSTNYNHFNSYWCSLADMSSSRMEQPWRYYYALIFNANNTLNAIGNPDEGEEWMRHAYGTALVYRVLAYMDVMRMYEYKKTGVAALDAEADKNGVWGLTSVIVDENFDPLNATNNPRVPFYQMYRFIMNDLNRAEKYLEGYARPDKTQANVSVVQAYKARLWLEIATRFQKHPADLQTQISHENDEALAMYDPLGVTSAADCYRKAAEYARLAMSGYTPLTEAQWHSTTQGFNEATTPSWLFAITITSPNADYVQSRTNTFHSNCVTEFSRGYSRSQYFCYRMIDRSLYDRIGEGDWRKVTWIDPADAGKNPTPDKYHTLLDNTEWAKRNAYVGFKYRPNEGDTSENHLNALLTDFPIIRVEEMYFIEAEAKAYAEGLGAGVDALVQFLNTYRYNDEGYAISPTDVEDFVDNHLIVQKRIEQWGEGLSFFDIKRRELAITRGYPGTNWLVPNRFNSHEGYTPSWLNLYLPYEEEGSLNDAIIQNPDPSVVDSYGRWTE